MSPRHARPFDQDERDALEEVDRRYDGDYEVLGPESSRGRRVGIVLLSLLVLAALVLAGAALYVRGRLDPGGAPGEEVRVAVPTGSTNSDIARLLEDEDVIADAWWFENYLRFKGADGFQAGDYVFQENSAAWDVLSVLNGAPLPPETIAFTVPEGLTIREYPGEIVNDIASFDPARVQELLDTRAVPFPATVPDAPSYEGLLFPDTYQVGEGMDEAAVLSLMAAQFDRVATDIDLAGRAAALGLTPYEVVIVASLIQEEYGIVEEMPMMARVIYNRLEIGEPLGIDATSRYEAELAGRDRTDIDFESESPYNTRRNAGLPPTPIAAPGRLALEAALAPADGPWIFYVRDPDASRTPPGGHFFTDSASEFEQVKDECEEAGLGCG
jgi:UPF0755 protein